MSNSQKTFDMYDELNDLFFDFDTIEQMCAMVEDYIAGISRGEEQKAIGRVFAMMQLLKTFACSSKEKAENLIGDYHSIDSKIQKQIQALQDDKVKVPYTQYVIEHMKLQDRMVRIFLDDGTSFEKSLDEVKLKDLRVSDTLIFYKSGDFSVGLDKRPNGSAPFKG